MRHETDCGSRDDTVEKHDVLILDGGVPEKVVFEIVGEFLALSLHVGKVDEKPGTHVTLQGARGFLAERSVVLHQKVAVLEESTASDFLRLLRINDTVVEMTKCRLKISIQRLGCDIRIESWRDANSRPFSTEPIS
jgi:hypothetical protein